ncbi:hypothetical protein BDR03DRAFT_1028732 [Suillus americanus]|nr:hypothetical protein BDR03DRAFT_1028732 [Suillus americanus]
MTRRPSLKKATASTLAVRPRIVHADCPSTVFLLYDQVPPTSRVDLDRDRWPVTSEVHEERTYMIGLPYGRYFCSLTTLLLMDVVSLLRYRCSYPPYRQSCNLNPSAILPCNVPYFTTKELGMIVLLVCAHLSACLTNHQPMCA